MNRLAIGYAPDQIDRAVMVFAETRNGVLVQSRGERVPRLIDGHEEVRINGGGLSEVVPGDPSYFDVVLDSFSTQVFIRNVTELEPDVIASMLVAEENWDLLPRAASGLAPA